MAEDEIALSPRARGEKIIVSSQQGKSFEDLLDEAVSASKKGRRRKKKRTPAQTLISTQNVHEDMALERAEAGVFNLGAELDDDDQFARTPSKLLAGGPRVLAPIKPIRRQQHMSPMDLRELSDISSGEGVLLDPTVLNSLEEEGIKGSSSPAKSCSSVDKSPLKITDSRNSLSAASVCSSPVAEKQPARQPKRRRRKLEEQQQQEASIELKPMSPSVQAVPKSQIPESTDTLLKVSVHVCEVPLPSMPAAGIFLRVHVLDVESGCEFKTSHEDTITASSTGLVSKFKGKLAAVEEDLVFCLPLKQALESNAVLFLELFVPKLSSYSSCYAKIDLQERCIGWAFLKLRASTGEYNISSKLRLQIYEPLSLPKFSSSHSFKTVFGWWNRGPWKKTRCSVFVTVRGTEAHRTRKISNSSTNNNNNNGGIQRSNNGRDSDDDGRPASGSRIDVKNGSRANKDFDPALERKDGHLCKVPDKLNKSLAAATFPCLNLAFAPSGNFLAAATNQTIHVFQAADFGLKSCLEGHEGLIYCISWLHDDKWLVSSSADCLAIVWDVQNEIIAKMLPHPSFVYCAKFVPGERNAIVSGSKDKTLRVWKCNDQDDEEFDLWQELDGHQGFVTSICFDCNKTLYSADSEGHVLSWTSSDGLEWTLQREFLLADLRGVSISAIQNPDGPVLKPVRLATDRGKRGRLLCRLAGGHWQSSGQCVRRGRRVSAGDRFVFPPSRAPDGRWLLRSDPSATLDAQLGRQGIDCRRHGTAAAATTVSTSIKRGPLAPAGHHRAHRSGVADRRCG
ncbi:Hypothetical predicted protein [Cloeon dipterum]|uniref:Uncharacterized protein n=1 Tax=Cloeon dipterum TaxID=197152 RepID=A0A8S1DCL7_9INSE|nr:Hypothetical predicted protein [Cloeon dipterum]